MSLVYPSYQSLSSLINTTKPNDKSRAWLFGVLIGMGGACLVAMYSVRWHTEGNKLFWSSTGNAAAWVSGLVMILLGLGMSAYYSNLAGGICFVLQAIIAGVMAKVTSDKYSSIFPTPTPTGATTTPGVTTPGVTTTPTR